MKKLILSLVLFILSCNMVFAGANIIDNVTTEDVYASGSVGVGTTTPSDKLNIVDGTSDIRLGATSAGYGGLWLSTQSTPAMETGNADGNLYIGSQAGSDIYLRNGSATNMVIKGLTGNVGIGTATPGAKLDIDQNDNVKGLSIDHEGTTTSAINVESSSQQYPYYFKTEGVLDTHYAGLYIENSATQTNPGTALFRVFSGTSDTFGDGLAHFNSAGASASNKVVFIENAGTGPGLVVDGTGTGYSAIFNDGNVGIGTTSPSLKLDVEANTIGIMELTNTGDSTVRFNLGDAGVYGTNTFVIADSVNAALMTVETDTGNVGIGTTNPTEKLTVAGNIELNGNALKNASTLWDISRESLILELSMDTSSLDPNDATILIESSTKNNFWTSNGPGTFINATAGPYGQGASEFDGSTRWYSQTLNDWNVDDDFTLCVRLSSPNYASTGGIIHKRIGSYSEGWWMVTSSDDIQFGIEGTGTESTTINTNALTPDVWYDVCGRRDVSDDKISVWVDGEFVRETTDTTTTPLWSTADTVFIGGGGSYAYDGTLISNVWLWNRSLSADEIMGISQQKMKGEEPYVYKTADNTLYGDNLFMGDVGIGTTSPSEKLEVVGNANITGNLTVGGVGEHGVFWNGTHTIIK